jgi:hypothetical protein
LVEELERSIQVKLNSLYNNLAIDAFAISAVLNKARFFSMTEIALILPIVAHRETMRKLSHATFRFLSFEQ